MAAWFGSAFSGKENLSSLNPRRATDDDDRDPEPDDREVLRDALLFQPPPTKSGTGRGKIYYAIQARKAAALLLVVVEGWGGSGERGGGGGGSGGSGGGPSPPPRPSYY